MCHHCCLSLIISYRKRLIKGVSGKKKKVLDITKFRRSRTFSSLHLKLLHYVHILFSYYVFVCLTVTATPITISNQTTFYFMWSNRKLLATVGLMQMFQDQCTACFDAVRLKLYISHLYDNLHIISNLNLPNASQRKLSASRRFLCPPPAFLKNLEQQGFGSDFVFQSQICYSPTCQASKTKN